MVEFYKITYEFACSHRNNQGSASSTHSQTELIPVSKPETQDKTRS